MLPQIIWQMMLEVKMAADENMERKMSIVAIKTLAKLTKHYNNGRLAKEDFIDYGVAVTDLPAEAILAIAAGQKGAKEAYDSYIN